MTQYSRKPANSLRGASRADDAVAIHAIYKPGDTLTSEQLDAWFESRERLMTPPPGTPKEADAWLAHLQRRHQELQKLNKATTHPRLWEHGIQPFSIDAVGGQYEVRAAAEAVVAMSLQNKVAAYVKAQIKRVSFFMEGIDEEKLPLHDQVRLDTVYRQLQHLNGGIQWLVKGVNEEIQSLESSIRLQLTAGRIKVKQLIPAPAEVSEAENIDNEG